MSAPTQNDRVAYGHIACRLLPIRRRIDRRRAFPSIATHSACVATVQKTAS